MYKANAIYIIIYIIKRKEIIIMIATITQPAILVTEYIRRILSEKFAISYINISNGFKRNIISVTFNNLLNYQNEPQQRVVIDTTDRFLDGLTPFSLIRKRTAKTTMSIDNITKKALGRESLGYSYLIEFAPQPVPGHANTIFYIEDMHDPKHRIAEIYMDSNKIILTSFKKLPKKTDITFTITSIELAR